MNSWLLGQDKQAARGWLRAYFSSGWAFLVPYALLFFAYRILRLPANTHAVTLDWHSWAPPMLTIYYGLHATHGILAILAFGDWRTACASKASSTRTVGILPWACLALILFIPGAYLEWPSDAWEHLRRIQECSLINDVATHSAEYKGLYFLIYSLIGWAQTDLPFAAGIYVGCVGMLLAWQTYLLGCSLGLPKPWAFAFVMANLLSYGNSTFSYIRYYGLSTSPLCEIAVLALVRLAVTTRCRRFRRIGATDATAMQTRPNRDVLRTCLKGAALLCIIGASHVQGLGIAAFSIASVVAWRIVKQRRSNVWWILLFALILSALVILSFGRSPTLRSTLTASGWFGRMYGFDILSLASPSGNRAAAIVALFGIFEATVALFLLFRNNVAGWLTLGPPALLMLPATALPLAMILGGRGEAGIITFHRMLLAIPTGLATVTALELASRLARKRMVLGRFSDSHCVGAVGLTIALVFLFCTDNLYSAHRIWHLISQTPRDCTFADLQSEPRRPPDEKFACHGSVGYVAETLRKFDPLVAYRLHTGGLETPAYDFDVISYVLATKVVKLSGFVALDPRSVITPGSTAAISSGHWPSYYLAISLAGSCELAEIARTSGLEPPQIEMNAGSSGTR